MSQDDRTDDARRRDRADDIDDGMIHEWLDGELGTAQAAELEALIASSPSFAARVAEARGLLAASSRILSALDEVPGNVLPKGAATEVRPLARPASPHVSRTVKGSWSARRWTGIAALLMVGVTGVVIARREPESTRVRESVFIASEGADDSVSDGSQSASGLAVAEAARSESAVAQRASAAPALAAPASPPVVMGRTAAPLAKATVDSGGEVRRRDSLAALRRLRAPLQPVTSASGIALPERLADAPVSNASAAGSRAAVSGQGSVAMRRMMSADQSAAFEAEPAPPSDILSGDMMLAVQRVSCAPGCVQVRIEVARDGRVRRWRQSLGSSGSPDTAMLDDQALTELSRIVAELRLDTLPTMLRLDGAQCRSVGSLRESLRVEFVHNDELRRVMGLPWCSNGTHVLDKAAAAIEAAADRALSRESGASSRYW